MITQGYIPINVYRSKVIGNCTKGGVSSTTDVLYVRAKGGHVEPESVPSELKFRAEKRGDNYWALIPESVDNPIGLVSFGGNLAGTSDGRSPSRVFHIHDRVESKI